MCTASWRGRTGKCGLGVNGCWRGWILCERVWGREAAWEGGELGVNGLGGEGAIWE